MSPFLFGTNLFALTSITLYCITERFGGSSVDGGCGIMLEKCPIFFVFFDFFIFTYFECS